jgi:ABC-type sugar transport system ATPase subunit
MGVQRNRVHLIRKSFGGVQAVRGVSFSLNAGEVVALVGDNGAGKSTTIKMVSGAIRRDHGTIRWEGRDIDISSPDDARSIGIETMYQDLALVPDLDVAANVFLGREPMKRLLGVLPVLDREGMRIRARALLDRVNIRILSLDQPVRSLSGRQRQATAIARFLLNERPKLIIMDEPTAALGVQEQRKVLDLIRTLKGQGITILVISHNLEHVFEVCERIIVLRAGQVEAIVQTSEVDKQAVVSLVMGGGRV